MFIMQRVVEAIKELNKRCLNIRAIETGTIRSYHEKHESTKYIAKTLGNNGSLISVDINPKSIEISRKICAGLNNITWVESDSISYLKKVDVKFDFVLLDSKNDDITIWNEFCAVFPKINVDGILIVDDAGIRLDGKGIDKSAARKGHLVWSKLKDKVMIKVLDTPHGSQLRVDFSSDNIKKIRSEIKEIS